MAKSPAEIRSLARSHTKSAINVLRTIMNQPDAPASARVAAAEALLDRGWGKPGQHHTGEVEHKHYVARIPLPSSDVDEWQRQVLPLKKLM